MENDVDIQSLTNSLIQYTVLNSPTYVPDEKQLANTQLTDLQSEYLQGLINHTAPKDLCIQLGVARIMPYIWCKQNKLFAQAVDLIKQLEADDLESVIWTKSMNPNANPITQMFALKSRKQEYKDNALPTAQGTVNIKISVGENQFKVVQSAEQNEDE